ncbi:uncharacterized protein ColSpa_00983 [Colletotrichum spaethianum]|uniref:Uncharacterized protein n=1 Tax=Colletotrichum spaethianum TaxID=700344 RepID=A0AA37L2R8_9PEZI|nr:uncharacterized protein ColSpa_00983 [Colletotrichum spaethianum]GKT40802.1 hypothetical protein ColSpa_00983 [Colletotrichum spaethianum]
MTQHLLDDSAFVPQQARLEATSHNGNKPGVTSPPKNGIVCDTMGPAMLNNGTEAGLGAQDRVPSPLL